MPGSAVGSSALPVGVLLSSAMAGSVFDVFVCVLLFYMWKKMFVYCPQLQKGTEILGVSHSH